MTNQAPLDVATPFGNNNNVIVDIIEQTADITVTAQRAPI